MVSGIINIIYEIIDIHEELDLIKGPATPLLGPGSNIDSIELVSLIIDIEDTVNARFGTELSLTSESALSPKSSPFRNLGTLADYICTLLGEANVRQ